MTRRYLLAVLVSFVVHLSTCSALGQDPVEEPLPLIPAPTMCTTGTPPRTLAAFTLIEYRDILVIRERALHGLELEANYRALEVQLREVSTQLSAANAALTVLREAAETRTELLQAALGEHLATNERLRARLDRRRWAPWVTLSVGLAAGVGTTAAIAAGR